MPISTLLSETPVRVRYAETDASGITHHSAYVPWLEVGRVAWLREAGDGMSYAELEGAGYSLPVTDLRLRYVKATHFDDRLVVRTVLAEIRSRSLRFLYEIVTAGDPAIQVANGSSDHICLHHGRIAKLPASLRALAGR